VVDLCQSFAKRVFPRIAGCVNPAVLAAGLSNEKIQGFGMNWIFDSSRDAWILVVSDLTGVRIYDPSAGVIGDSAVKQVASV